MLRKTLFLGASALGLTLAAPVWAKDIDAIDIEAATKIEEEAATSATPAPPATPTMSFGTWGVDPASLDSEMAPGDDFFAYVNGRWLRENPLPPEHSRFGAFNLLREKSTSDVKVLVDELVASNPAPGSHERRIVDAYNSYLDTAAIEAAGMAPMAPYLNEIYSASDLEGLATLWSKPGMPSPIGGYVTVDQKQPDTYAPYIYSGGLGLPDRQYYLDTSEKGLEIQEKYREFLAFLLGEAGYEDAAGAAQAVYNFEEKIARDIAWDRTTRRNRDLTYNAMTRAELLAMGGGFPINILIENSGVGGAEKFVVPYVKPDAERAKELGLSEEQSAAIGSGTPGMLAMLAETDIATMQAWSAARFMAGNADILPEKFDAASFAFYGKTLRGQPEQRPRWKRAISETESHLGELLGKSYVARYFPEENKAAMDALVANLGKAMAQSIDALDWMGADTKVEAHDKLESFDPKIGYRENLENYEGLAIIAGDPMANRMAASAWGWQDNIAKLGQPIDRTEWGMLPQTVNAYYNSSKNEIVFPAAILQQPFFGITADPAVNYGGIGGVIGHEIGHGFDDQGSKSDGTGKLRNWWQDQDLENFQKRTNALVAQYNGFCPLDDGETCVNGRLTLGENIGDLGGLSLAYRAYKLHLDGKEDRVIDGLTGDQRFFLAWAQVWRSQQREDNARQRLRTDPHSPEEFRTNGVVRNMDAWYEAFNVTKDHKLYLPPEERITIW